MKFADREENRPARSQGAVTRITSNVKKWPAEFFGTFWLFRAAPIADAIPRAVICKVLLDNA